jgi:hypothetical protein
LFSARFDDTWNGATSFEVFASIVLMFRLL